MNLATASALADAPRIPELRFRHVVDATDYQGMATIREQAGVWDQVDRRSAREGIPGADDLARIFPLADATGNPDLLLVEHNAKLIGYCHVWWRWTEITGVRVYLHVGHLLPEWRSQGIGRVLVRWAEARIREIAAQDNPQTATFATNVSSTEPQADALMRHMGYTAVRRLSDMILEPNPAMICPPLPTNVVLRLVEPQQYRALYQAWKDALSDFWTSTPESDADYQEFLADHIHTSAFTPELWQVAWTGDIVVGVVMVVVTSHGGIIDQVTVRRAWHRRGIGRALMSRALLALRQRGIEHIRLYTDAADEHGARSLYEQLGFRETKQHIFYRKPFSI